MRSIGLDIHRDFCEVAIAEAGEIRSPGRIEITPAALKLFAQSLAADDRVALEVSGNAWEVARIIKPHVARVAVVSPAETGIPSGAREDRPPRCPGAGEAPGRGLARCGLGTRRANQGDPPAPSAPAPAGPGQDQARNEVHAALARRLISRPSFSDLFGKRGREWLERVERPTCERETVDGCMRQFDFCEREIEAIERVVATEALRSPEVRRLMTVPGVNVITAATFMAAIGDIRRFESPRKLVGYLGLDPKVRQSGQTQAAPGRISKQGSASGRHALVEASRQR